MKRIHSSAPKLCIYNSRKNVSTRPCVLPSRGTDANATFARFRRRRARGVARVASSIGFPLSFRGDSYLLAHLYSPLSFSWSNKTNLRQRKRNHRPRTATPRDRRIARVPRDSSAPNIYYRAERITKTGGGRKRRRKRRRTLFFCLRLCVGEFVR